MSHPLCSQLIKQDMRSLTHKRINITKRTKKVEVELNEDIIMNELKQDSIEEEPITTKPKEALDDNMEITPQVIEVDALNRPEISQLDTEVYHRKLFMHTDYPMFSFGEGNREEEIYVDCYGVNYINKKEIDDMYLDDLQQKLNEDDLYLEKENEDVVMKGTS